MSLIRRLVGNGPGARSLRASETGPPDASHVMPRPARPTVPSGASVANREERAFAPHCDGRILHAPGECWSCDLYPDWQKLRELWGIAFTGHQPEVETANLMTGASEEPVKQVVIKRELPCPADYNRPPDSDSDHRQWGPNQAQGGRHG